MFRFKGIDFPNEETARKWYENCLKSAEGTRLFHERLKSGETSWADVCRARRAMGIQPNSVRRSRRLSGT